MREGREKDTLIAATIRVNDTNIGTVSDLHGYFQLQIPKALYAGEVRLTIQALGMQSEAVTVQLDEKSLSEELVVIMKTMATTGLMLIDKNGKPYHSDNSLRARLRRLFSRR
ncbi:carboxypeptidase-like regulatory domain-containing protein [Chitinophaga pinensis]|uniref:Carboxypeptidase-like regulatory domain-containing protein n=1 Tax=Chitinophaga pinensis TaxID=79329 RepID=A0A5C6LY76_9BACT|nr:carboxypeptidase-like regulatory domain-containing protein [Chitinophaga pinensis]TWW00589.1 carboxypeptidase-like regulatory domain-containing protein [Chitinophaga pinensis]